MPTQEERLITLEQNFTISQRENGKHIREIQENATITIGLIQAQGLDIKRISTRLETMGESLDGVDQRLVGIEQRLGTLEQDMSDVKGLLGQIIERLPK
ncbi:MAG: hypothetical protein NVS4B11_30830 [Ktedonobacteraceae bacterium]